MSLWDTHSVAVMSQSRLFFVFWVGKIGQMSRKITALKVQQRNKERVSVFLDEEYAFSMPLLEAASLRKGQVLTPEDIARLQAIDERHQAYDRAVRFLAHRPRSISEIRRKLQEYDVDDVVIDEVIVRLENYGYVNDEEFARFWVRNREEFAPRGVMALRTELRQKGISNQIIETVFSDLDSYDSAYKAAQSKLRSLRGKDQQTFRRRLTGFLGRRGFDYGTINEVLQKLIEELTYSEDDTPYFLENMQDSEE